MDIKSRSCHRERELVCKPLPAELVDLHSVRPPDAAVAMSRSITFRNSVLRSTPASATSAHLVKADS